MIRAKKIKFEKNNIKSVISPLIEIVHFDKFNKQSKKETYPITHYMDSGCHSLKELNTHLN